MTYKKFKIWSGIYKNFNDTTKKIEGRGFESKKYINTNYKELKKCLKDKKYINKFSQRYKGFNYIISSIISKNINKKIKVLDFGGGFCNGYLLLENTLDKKLMSKINYNIVDLASINSLSKKHFPKIKFHEKIPNQKFDLIITSSCIQYIEDWKGTINKLCKLDSKCLVFFDLFIGKISNFVTLQKYYNSLIPHWFLNENNFINEVLQNNYSKTMIENTDFIRLDNLNNLDMGNFKKKFRLDRTKNIIFIKN